MAKLAYQRPPDKGRICRIGGGTDEVHGDNCKFNLKPNETAVWLL